MNRRERALTAAEFVVALQAIDPDMIIRDTDVDYNSAGYDTIEHAFAGVTVAGALRHGKILDVYDSWERDGSE